MSDATPPITTLSSDALTAAGHPLLMLLDFDGTLVDIAPHPEAIVVPTEAAPTLRAIARAGHRVVIVTGRNRDFVIHRLGLTFDDVIQVVGLHGLEWPGEPPPPRHPRLDDALTALRSAVSALPGGDRVHLEDKGLSIAVHTRQVDRAALPAILAVVQAVLAGFVDDALCTLHGHEVIELRPRAASKALAARRLVQGTPGRAVVMFGDDRTDEEAFAALPAEALTVRVGPPDIDSVARARVADPAAVWAALAGLAPSRQRSSSSTPTSHATKRGARA